jgi:hypothetical protein
MGDSHIAIIFWQLEAKKLVPSSPLVVDDE